MVSELIVLAGVKHFEQGGLRVSIAARLTLADFVDLVQQKDWVVCLDLDQGLDDDTRHTTDVGSPVTSDQSFISDSSQSNFVELSTKSLSDALSETCFANSRWTTEA